MARGSRPWAPGATAGAGGVALLPEHAIWARIGAMRRPTPIVRAAGALACLAGALGAGFTAALGAGCAGPARPGPESYARAYPYEVGQSVVHDIQVFRAGTRLKLTNTTARSFGPGTVWVNQRFSRPVEGLGVGASLDLDLYEFVDEFGETFRAGGFFATQDPDPVVLVQYETAADEAVHGFVLVRDEQN